MIKNEMIFSQDASLFFFFFTSAPFGSLKIGGPLLINPMHGNFLSWPHDFHGRMETDGENFASNIFMHWNHL